MNKLFLLTCASLLIPAVVSAQPAATSAPASTPSSIPVTSADPVVTESAPPPSKKAESEDTQAALELYRACETLLKSGRDEAALGCFQGLIAEHPKSSQAASAKSLVSTLAPPADEIVEEVKGAGFSFELGRLELAGAAGMMGVVTGPLLATMVNNSGVDINPGIVTLGSGVTSIGLGVGLATAGYFVTDEAYFGSTVGRFGTSALVYGLSAGLATGTIFSTFVNDTETSLLLLSGAILAGGYGGMGAGLAISRAADYSEDNATYISVVGSMSMILGALALPNVAVFAPDAHPSILPLSYLLVSGAGVTASALTAKRFELTSLQSLIGAGGGLLGLMVMAPIGGVAAIQISSDPRVIAPIATGSMAVGMLGGFATTIVLQNLFLGTSVDGEASEGAPTAFRVEPPSMGALVDSEQNVVPSMNVLRFRW